MAHKLLLADDSVTIQRVIELTFADEDIDVTAVGDGQLAIDRLDTDRFDIVLADVDMPKRDGYEVAAYVKSRPKLAHIPVVLLTGAFEPIDQARADAAGSSDVLAKPFEPQMVINRVKELLSKKKEEDTLTRFGTTPAMPPAAPPAMTPVAPTAMTPAATPAMMQAMPARTPARAVPEPKAQAEPPPGGVSLDDYFDQLDAAFSSLQPAAPAAPPEHTTPHSDMDWSSFVEPAGQQPQAWTQSPPLTPSPPPAQVQPWAQSPPMAKPLPPTQPVPLTQPPPVTSLPPRAKTVTLTQPPRPPAPSGWPAPPIIPVPTSVPHVSPVIAAPPATPAPPEPDVVRAPVPVAPAPVRRTAPVPPGSSGNDATKRAAESLASVHQLWKGEPAHPAAPVQAPAPPPPAPTAPARADLPPAAPHVVPGPPGSVPPTNPFASLSAAKAELAAAAAARPVAPVITEELVEEIVSRVLRRMSDHVVRETVTEIVSKTAERAVKDEIERIKGGGE